MNKSNKESYSDGNHSSSLRRTVPNKPSSSRKSEEHSHSDSSSSSSDSSPDRKKKCSTLNARGSDSGVVFNRDELKKFSITVHNSKAKPPNLHISNPEEIAMIRRAGEHRRSLNLRRRNSSSSDSKNEGTRPIFDKIEKKDRSLERSPETRRNSSSRREHSRRKHRSRTRPESPSHRMRRSRIESPPSRKYRRYESSPSSSDSSSSSGERNRRKKYYYNLKAEREEKERKRQEFEREMYVERFIRERRKRKALAHFNGSKMSSYPRERSKEMDVYSSRPKEPPGPYPRSRSPDSPPSPPYPSYHHMKERPKEPPLPYPYIKGRSKEYPSSSRERMRETYSDEEEEDSDKHVKYHTHSSYHPAPPTHSPYIPPHPHQSQPMMRPMYPVRMPPPVSVHQTPSGIRVVVNTGNRAPVPGVPVRHVRPRMPYMRPGMPVRPPMRPFMPVGMPGYPPPVGYYPRPRLPVPFRPIRCPPGAPPRVTRPPQPPPSST